MFHPFLILPLVLLFSVLGNAANAANEAHFPRIPSSVNSPDGRYRITYIFHSYDSHTLSFKKSKDRESKPFYSCGTDVDVLWSPDCKQFAVNDNMGSNVASALLFETSDLSKPLDLGEKLSKSLSPSRNLRSMAGNTHIYFNVLKWISPTKLEMV